MNNSSGHHPKIQTEDRADILYIKRQLLQRAKETLTTKRDSLALFAEPFYTKIKTNPKRLDTLLSGDSGSRHEMDKVALVQRAAELCTKRWVESVMSLASGSIQVNGMEYDVAFNDTKEYEPVDYKLIADLEAVDDQIIALRERLIQKKRAIKSSLKVETQQNMDAVFERLKCELNPTQLAHSEEDAANNVPNVIEETFESLQKKFTKILELAAITNETVPGTMNKLERAISILDTVKPDPSNVSSSASAMPLDNSFIPQGTPRSGFVRNIL